MVSAVSAGLAGLLVDASVRRRAQEQIEERLRYEVTMTAQMTASALFGPLATDDTSLQGPISELAAAVKTHLSVLSAEGIIAADSEGSMAGRVVNDASAPEIVLALKNHRGSAVRGVGEARRLWVAESIVRDGQLLGIARASVPMSVVDEQVKGVRHRIFIAAAIALLLGSLMALVLSVGIARPIARLARAARRIGEGRLDTRTGVTGHDEIGDLGRALDDMSSSLQTMIHRLDLHNREMRRVLDAIDQGLVVVGMDGSIEGERSLRIDEWFGVPEAGCKLWQLFSGANDAARLALELNWGQLADRILPQDVLLDQLPARIERAGRIFDLAYAPIVEPDGSYSRLLVVVSDMTLLVETERQQERQRDVVSMLGRTLENRNAVLDFLREADALVQDLQTQTDGVVIGRKLHTLKGNSLAYGIQSVASLCHELENELASKDGLASAEREALSRLWRALRTEVDVFLGAQDGIVLTEAELVSAIDDLLSDRPRDALARRLASWLHSPVEPSLSFLAERAQDLAKRLGKEQLAVVVKHDNLRLDRARWAPLWSALVHAVRNAVAHGMQEPGARARLGKSGHATLSLSALRVKDGFEISLSDDGPGADMERIASKLKAMGLPAETEEELLEGLFQDGMSCADAVSQSSGRGIGMGALREVVRALGGSVALRSVRGEGLTLTCRFPEPALDLQALRARRCQRQPLADAASVPTSP